MFQKIAAFFKREEQYAEGQLKAGELFVDAVAEAVAAKVTAAIKRDLAKVKAAIPKAKAKR